MSQKWTFNGIELEVDLQDADFAEKYEAAFERMGRDEKEVQKAGTNSEIIRGYCGLFFHLFDDLYGPGTSEKLFEKKVNAGLCDAAYEAFLNAAKACNAEAAQRRTNLTGKYTPNQNRQQKRYYQNHRERK